MKKIAILLCGGAGSRMQSAVPKQFLKLDNGYSVLQNSVLKFAENGNIDAIIIVANEAYRAETEQEVNYLNLSKPCKIVNGGESRSASSAAGVKAIENPDPSDIVLIHDVARPFVSNEIIDQSCSAMTHYQAVSTVIPSSDTIYILNEHGEIESIPDRKNLCNVQTPQTFRYRIIAQAHAMAAAIGKNDFTDDSSMIHYFNLAEVGTVTGSVENKKITYLTDL
ncbi:MAG: 2-C-methyl-D-erythritol 4-phosphate cytidylyltransferase [Lentisphaeria bacterium]|nr:2-C-methyl-D-erythritol 4-phosphate cytidylyltransferase [Lentisphaeria bacterium]